MIPEFHSNLIIRGKIKCITGLHIGGSKEKLEIGGVDAPVLRDPLTRYPYIPGSSIKGRLRTLIEYALGLVDPKGDPSDKDKIVSIFGKSADDKTKPEEAKHPGPTPLIVRDAFPDEETIKLWKDVESELQFTEYKPENTINRITSAANPRFLERVVPGSCFDFEMVYTVYGNSPEKIQEVNDNLINIKLGLQLIEDHALGKSGSRGYGKVVFLLGEVIELTKKDYKEASQKYLDSKETNFERKTLAEWAIPTITA